MSSLRKAAAGAALFAAASLLFAVVTMSAIPDEFVEGLLRGLAERNAGVTFTAGGFKKSFPLRLELKEAVLFRPGERGEAIYVDNAIVALSPFGLILGRVDLAVRAALRGGGELTADASLRSGSFKARLDARGISPGSIPALSKAGLSGGSLSISGSAGGGLGGCPEGRLTFEGSGLDLSGLKGVPFAAFLNEKARVTGEASFKECGARIEGLNMEIKGLSARFSGDVLFAKGGGEVDMGIELTVAPDESFQLITPLIEKYKRSSNFYSMRIKGPVGAVTLYER